MFRLCLLAALAVVASAHIYPSTKTLAGVNLSKYWYPKYCAPIRLRYPHISDLTCYYIVYYYIHSPPKYYLQHLHLPGLAKYGSRLPHTYWVQYLSQLVDLLPSVFYSDGHFRGQLKKYIGGHYPRVVRTSVYYDHLALCDTYFSSQLVTPYGWNRFKSFYSRHLLKLHVKTPHRRYYSSFPRLRHFISRLRGHSFVSMKSYFKKITIKPLVVGSTKLVYPRQPYFQRQKLWFPRQTLLGLYEYLSKRNYPWDSWFSKIKKISTPKRITWGQGYTGLVCHRQYTHLSFLCPAWEHGLLPVLRLRFSSYPKHIVYSKRITFQRFLSGFLYQWRPKIRVYSQSLVTNCLLAFDNYACRWLGTHYHSQYPACRASKLWYPGFYHGGCKGHKCHG